MGLEALLGGGDDGSSVSATEPMGIRVIPETQRNILWIVAPTELYPTIIDVIKTLDTPASIERDYEVVVLERLDADEVQQTIEELLGLNQTQLASRVRGAAQRRGQQGDDPQQLADQLAQQMLQIGEKEGSTKDLKISSMPATNSIIVFGPKDIREIVVQIIEKLEAQGSETRAYQYALDNADAASLAKTLSAVYGVEVVEDAELRGPVYRLRRMLRPIRSISKPRRLCCLKFSAAVAQAEAQASEINPRTIQIVSGDAESIAKSLNTVFSKRKAGQNKILIAADSTTNQLIVAAPDQIYQEISSLAATLDKPDANQALPKFYELQYAYAPEVKDKVMEMVKQLAVSSPAAPRRWALSASRRILLRIRLWSWGLLKSFRLWISSLPRSMSSPKTQRVGRPRR